MSEMKLQDLKNLMELQKSKGIKGEVIDGVEYFTVWIPKDVVNNIQQEAAEERAEIDKKALQAYIREVEQQKKGVRL